MKIRGLILNKRNLSKIYLIVLDDNSEFQKKIKNNINENKYNFFKMKKSKKKILILNDNKIKKLINNI